MLIADGGICCKPSSPNDTVAAAVDDDDDDDVDVEMDNVTIDKY